MTKDFVTPFVTQETNKLMKDNSLVTMVLTIVLDNGKEIKMTEEKPYSITARSEYGIVCISNFTDTIFVMPEHIVALKMEKSA